MSALTDHQLRVLWERFTPEHWLDWGTKQSRVLREVHQASPEKLASVDMQRWLWTEREMGGVGAGRSVSVERALTDETTVSALVALRERVWPDDVSARAAAIQHEFWRILESLVPRLCKRRPRARLQRVFTTLLPQHMHCAYQYRAERNIADLVLGERQSGIAVVVRVRARLRLLENPEEGWLNHAKMSIFCWWLHANFDAIKRGDERFGGPVQIVDQDSQPPLVIWSATRQRKSLTSAGGHVSALRAVVQACQGGETQEGIRTALREEHSIELSVGRFRGLMRAVKFLELIVARDGQWFPSDTGEVMLDTDPPEVADELVERMIVRFFGVALLLRVLRDRTLAPKAVYQTMRELHPGWNNDQAVRKVIRWVHALDLIERDEDAQWTLSELGREWAARLPTEIPTLQEEAIAQTGEPDDPEEGDEPPLAALSAEECWRAPSFADIWRAFQADPELARFIFDREQVRQLHLAWHLADPASGHSQHKRFVVLSGLSGTGKTALLLHYVRVYCRLIGISRVERHREVAAASPDWRDPSGLLGYFNALGPDPMFVREPTLDLVLDANRDPGQPYFLILDEMNLAHVERYFAPFLSAMETGSRLHFHAYRDATTDVPPSVRWPRNLFIGGTVNMDETTHALSDKVLDRAFVLEFWQVDLAGFCARRKDRDQALIGDVQAVYDWLIELNARLYQVRRHVGYRAFGEALDYLCAAAREPDFAATELWAHVDHAVYAKVLPRFRGHRSRALEQALASANALCAERGMTTCTDKLTAMQAMLEETGMVRFFG